MPFKGGVLSGLVVIGVTATIFVFVLAFQTQGCNQRFVEAEMDKRWINVTQILDVARGTTDLGFDIIETQRPEAIFYLITATVPRLLQIAELNRLAQLVLLIPNSMWVIVEDNEFITEQVLEVIYDYGLSDRAFQIASATPEDHKAKHWCEGLAQRNAGLLWVRNMINDNLNNKAIVYFLEEGYTHTLRLFQEMTQIERGRIGVWPVGFSSEMIVEKPLVHDGRVVAWNTRWHPKRKFPLDIGGFAVTYDILLEYPFARFSVESEPGHAESDFLQEIIYSLDRLQPMANNCTDVLVWHTETRRPSVDNEPSEGGPVSYLMS